MILYSCTLPEPVVFLFLRLGQSSNGPAMNNGHRASERVFGGASDFTKYGKTASVIILKNHLTVTQVQISMRVNYEQPNDCQDAAKSNRRDYERRAGQTGRTHSHVDFAGHVYGTD